MVFCNGPSLRLVFNPDGPASPDQRRNGQQDWNKRTPGIQWRGIIFFFMNVEREFVVRRFRLIAGNNVVRYGLLVIDAQEAGISAHKSAIKNSSGKQIELLIFQGLQPSLGYLGGLGNFG